MDFTGKDKFLGVLTTQCCLLFCCQLMCPFQMPLRSTSGEYLTCTTKNMLRPDCPPRTGATSLFFRKYFRVLRHEAPNMSLLRCIPLNAAGHVRFGTQMTQTSLNPEQSLVLTGVLRFEPAGQFVERDRSFRACASNMGDLLRCDSVWLL
jgi:hypothetical protein